MEKPTFSLNESLKYQESQVSQSEIERNPRFYEFALTEIGFVGPLPLLSVVIHMYWLKFC